MSSFPKPWALGVINKMQDYYQARFDNTFPKRQGASDVDYIDKLADIACDVFDGLTPDDIKRGLAKMKTSKFCPVFPEFRDWCIGDLKAQWLGANEAWNTARGSIDFSGNELTVVWTKESATAFDSVIHLVRLGDKYQIADAKKAYVEMYDRLVAESLDRGEKPSYFISQGDDKEQHKVALREAESAGLLLSGSTDLLLESHQSPSDAKNEGKKFNSIAQEHIAKLRETLKIKNAPVVVVIDDEKPIGFIQAENLPEWADPFDEPEKYKEGLKADGKAIPFALRNNF